MTRPAPTPLVLCCLTACVAAPASPDPQPPNVVIVMTDDQGYGDFGFQGTPHVRTPNLDGMSARSAHMETFYVNPVCAPTRAALMTGRWTQRSTAIDTYIGRAMLASEEVTIAEILGDAGWATGIFGKWHLGDCFPMRPQDQGFEHSLVHRGGGIGQPSDPLGAEGRYTDAVLLRNGVETETSGYCTDVYFDEAIDWMADQHGAGRPFFSYIATNAPHGPFHDVPQALYERYVEEGVEDRLARIFAMIENIDLNMGRLFEALADMGVADDTLVLFLVDNGPNTRRFVGELRGMKSEVFEGGVRSPLLACWPAALSPGVTSDRIAAHVDLLPTVLDACGVAPPAHKLDGRSLLPLLRGAEVEWPDRALVIQSHRGDAPERYHNALVRTQRWKLVNPSGFGERAGPIEPAFELYDMEADPGETADLAAEQPEVVGQLRDMYDRWFEDVGATDPQNYEPPRILLGAPEAPSVWLTRQDWRRRSDDHGWDRDSMGVWEVGVVQRGPYRVRVRYPQGVNVERVTLAFGDNQWSAASSYDAPEFTFEEIQLPAIDGSFRAELSTQGKVIGAYQVQITYTGA